MTPEPVSRADILAVAAMLTLVGRLLTQHARDGKPGKEGPSRLLTAAEVGKLAGMSRRWAYDNASRFPFARRIGRSIRFGEAGLLRWLEGQQVLERRP